MAKKMLQVINFVANIFVANICLESTSLLKPICKDIKELLSQGTGSYREVV